MSEFYILVLIVGLEVARMPPPVSVPPTAPPASRPPSPLKKKPPPVPPKKKEPMPTTDELVVAIHDYKGEESSELSFRKGDVITVLKKFEDKVRNPFQ